jgi:hypothetical protein
MSTILTAVRRLFGVRCDRFAADRRDRVVRQLEREGIESLVSVHGRSIA